MNTTLDLNEPLENQFEAAEDKEQFFEELAQALADMETGVEEGLFPQAILDEFAMQFNYLMARHRFMTGTVRETTPDFNFGDESPEP